MLTGSVSLAVVPYGVYVALGGSALEDASTTGSAAYQARVFVNLLVTIFIAGPHMYATFTRTILDPDYVRRHLGVIGASALIPVAVVAAAVTSYQTYVWLLTVFFGLASLHALQQVVWLCQAYNRRAGIVRGSASHLVDYGVVLISLYPIAVYKMVRGEFRIGPVPLEYDRLIYGWHWLAVLALVAFSGFLALYVVKTVLELARGCLNFPKTAMIAVTVPVMFVLPALPNLDTAFQGVNAWHSFQYLALTWWANRVRGDATRNGIRFMQVLQPADCSRGLWSALRSRIASLHRGAGWATYYLLCFALVPVSGLLVLVARFAWPNLHAGLPGSDEVYEYLVVLSVLLVHYFHDAFLFSDADALVASSTGSTSMSTAAKVDC